MFKFIKQYAESISGIDIYPLISLLIFLIFFVMLLAYVFKMDKSRVAEISSLPLENEGPHSSNN